ncbi:N-acetylneuraminate synthase [Mariprofundus erugo]|uniref:N-acetylneuraminate synthase n=1 Tax=Mariprofundus erugo TaxID=2528639 RepID=A0A5R9GU34_9PROT|nr:N-acetylneuraminate synthase [Mariprofundus erugo]TLS66734.1 N-acetylneuraminate synthase [Mariprofundus erugo]
MTEGRVFVIAEAGVNHNGSLEMARQLIDAAVEAGADAVKFQTFKADKLVTGSAEKAAYQMKATGKEESQHAMLKRLELSCEVHHELLSHCNKMGISFLSTAFDEESLNFLVREIGLRTLKVPSGEITNGPLLLAHAQTGCDLIVSTGMATLEEIEAALGVIAFGLLGIEEHPSINAFRAAYESERGKSLLKEKVTLLHCTTEYPAPPADINLRAMQTMRSAFGLRVGYSDHSEGIAVSVAAAALGATLIEKHFTLDKTLDGPDHKASLEPEELSSMVAAIRTVELALGTAEKKPAASELKNRAVARKSLVASELIREGELFSMENMTVKRPGNGMSPFRYWQLLGKRASRDYASDEMIAE